MIGLREYDSSVTNRGGNGGIRTNRTANIVKSSEGMGTQRKIVNESMYKMPGNNSTTKFHIGGLDANCRFFMRDDSEHNFMLH